VFIFQLLDIKIAISGVLCEMLHGWL